MNKLKIVVDENIASSECFEFLGEVIKLNGREISNQNLRECDILIVRSVTKVDQQLLKNTKVRFVGTATSGIEHVDLNYLFENKIHFADAIGCNAFAVAEYVITAITKLLADWNDNFTNHTIGIIGFGNIGTKVARMCEALGIKVLLNDPPVQRINNSFISVPLNEILKCDIITLHVPLTFEGEDKTFNLLDENLHLLKENSILINTSRGGVVNETKLLQILRDKKVRLVTDVWMNEPNVNDDLLIKSVISTPHIAGYSIEGKINGTNMIFNKLNKFLGTDFSFDFFSNQNENEILEFHNKLTPANLHQLLKRIYDIEKDSIAMKEMVNKQSDEKNLYFDNLRKNYPHRKSFNKYLIRTSNKSVKSVLENLRFNVELI